MSKQGKQKQDVHSDIAEKLRSVSSNITNKMQRYTSSFPGATTPVGGCILRPSSGL